jgi:sphinganine-1-phosphate aldolase
MQSIPPRGWSRDDVFRSLAAFREHDMPVRGGRVWAYVYDPGPEIEALQKAAFLDYLTENALDPTVFPSLLRFENDVVAMAISHLGGGAEAVGNFTTGGTESVLLAVKTARDHFRAKHPGRGRPQMVLPVTAHACFHKAAQYFDVEPIILPARPDHRADVVAMRAAITDRTALIVGSAPSYAHGVIDPIEELGQLALEKEVLLHVDGCIGGFILPYFKKLGAPVPRFDLSVPGVTSISMDFHKYGFCPKGASVVLYKDKALRQHQIFACSSWSGYTIVNPTMLSTKSGGPIAACWATLHAIGEDGYLARAKAMLEATQRLAAGIQQIPGLYLMAQPDSCLIAFTSDELSPFHIVDEMRARDWYVQPQLGLNGTKENVHLSITPASLGHVEPFLADLRASTEAARRASFGPLVSELDGAIAHLDADRLGDAELAGLLAMAGVQGANLPERTSDINAVMNKLPRRLAERLLKGYMNDLYTPTA